MSNRNLRIGANVDADTDTDGNEWGGDPWTAKTEPSIEPRETGGPHEGPNRSDAEHQTSCPLPWARLEIGFAARTHIGMRRAQNEDAFVSVPEAGFFAVADGMGGHAGGAIASRLAVNSLQEYFHRQARHTSGIVPTGTRRAPAPSSQGEMLVSAIEQANRKIYDAALRSRRLWGMGTTVAALQFVEDGVVVAHVGDSRAYRFRAGKLERLTEDHSLLAEIERSQPLSEWEKQHHSGRNIITRALGPEGSVEVEASLCDVATNDVLLLCTDGLHGVVSDRIVASSITSEPELQAAATRLVYEANARGGPDNVTVILIRCLSD